MKHILTAAAALLLTVTASYAQKNRVRDVDYFPRSEIYLQYGTPSLMELSTILSPNFHDEVTNGETRNHKFSGIAAIGYNFFMYISDVDEFGPAGEPEFICRAVVMNYSCHLSGAFTYWQQGPMECSGALYLGVNYMDESVRDAVSDELEPNDHLNFSFHITAVKFRYGDMVGGFAELGFGYRGLVNVGLSIKI